MKTRNLGSLSSVHIVRIIAGLEIVFSDCKVDREERRRLDEVFAKSKLLVEEADSRVIDISPEAKVGEIDERVDRKWVVIRDVFAAVGRLADEVPMGEEAARLLKRWFPNGVAFTSQDSQLQLEHGRKLLSEMESETLSAPLKAFVAPILGSLKKDHVVYKAALDDKLVEVKRSPQLQAARAETIEALAALVGYIEVMATDEKSRARAERLLAPVDTMLESIRRPVSRKPDGETDVEPATDSQ